jgi:hypothetical protein
VSPVAQPAYPEATSELMQRDLKQESEEQVEAVTSKEEVPVEAETDDYTSEIYLYKLKTLKF